MATVMAGALIFIALRAAMTPERREVGWVRSLTGVNGRLLFGLLFVGWAIVFGVALQVVPHVGANSPYGGIALIALFTGFLIMMGFLWAVIGE
jgi:hypothetical protein